LVCISSSELQVAKVHDATRLLNLTGHPCRVTCRLAPHSTRLYITYVRLSTASQQALDFANYQGIRGKTSLQHLAAIIVCQYGPRLRKAPRISTCSQNAMNMHYAEARGETVSWLLWFSSLICNIFLG
jgi:hypothetical protein